MRSRKTKNESRLQAALHMNRHGYKGRAALGSALPMILFSLPFAVAFVAFTADIARTIYLVQVIKFGAQSAALAGFSYATNQDGSYSEASAKTNIKAAVLSVGGSSSDAWNKALAGPNGPESPPVTPIGFDDSDITFVNNPNASDQQDLFLQVRSRREGTDQLVMFFLQAMNFLGQKDDWLLTASPARTVEVLAQPASRIGSGSPKDSKPGSRAFELAGFAGFPLALSNEQFQVAAQPGQPFDHYTIDLVDSTQLGKPALPGHIKGCFVNVTATGDSIQYYGAGQGNVGIDQLIHSFEYFYNGAVSQAIAPGVLERGSQLACFDPADSVFKARKSEIISKLSLVMLNRDYILPVLRSNPSFTTRGEVVGFARMRLARFPSLVTPIPIAKPISVKENVVLVPGAIPVPLASGFSFEAWIDQSVPERNASFVNSIRSIPSISSTLLPVPVYPFVDRKSIEGNAIEARPRSIAMAPALSPRVFP